MTPFHKAALEYVSKHNFSVLPCQPKDKRPLTAHGCKDATRDLIQIEKWWEQWPNANVGIACGIASQNLAVLDVDGDEGQESLHQLESKYGSLPSTPCVLTGKGEQYYFHSQLKLKNLVGIYHGIDIRSEGGYVVAPPSIHPNGKMYAWEFLGQIGEVSLADIPEWLVKLCQNQRAASNDSRNWVDSSEKIKCGTRNQMLASYAGHLFRRYVDPSIAYALLSSWNQCAMETPLPEEEFKRTVDSIAGLEIQRRSRNGGHIE